MERKIQFDIHIFINSSTDLSLFSYYRNSY